MEETPEPAEPLPVTPNDRAPLVVRVIAGFLLVSGVCALLGFLLDLFTGRGLTLNFGLVSLPLGWGLLRRRERARAWTALIASLSLCVSFVGVLFMVLLVSNGQGEFDTSLNGLSEWQKWALLIGGLGTSILALIWAIRFLTSPQITEWFHPPADVPFIEWNPKRWKFGIGTLLFLTFLVALATASVMVHPSIQSIRAERWVETQDLNDPVYFPHGADPLPSAGSLAAASTSNHDGSGCCMQHATTEAGGLFPQPQLAYVVLDRWDNDQERLKAGVSSGMDRGEWTLSFEEGPRQEFTFPGSAQILERHSGKICTSDMRITLLEFWSFHEHPDAVWTLEGLESYIKDLRKRVAERDAARSVFP